MFCGTPISNESDDFVAAAARFYEMLVINGTTLRSSPNSFDIEGVFKKATGVSIRTYLNLGIALIGHVRTLAGKPGANPALNQERLWISPRFSKSWRRFIREWAVDRRKLLRLHQQNLRRFSKPHYNFLALERYPIVRTSRRLSYCMSLTFLDRKLGMGNHSLQKRERAENNSWFPALDDASSGRLSVRIRDHPAPSLRVACWKKSSGCKRRS